MKKTHLFAYCLHFVHIMRAYTRAFCPRSRKNRRICKGREDIPCLFDIETDFCQSLLQNREKRRKTLRKEQVKNTAKQHRKKRVCTCFPLQKTRSFAQKTRVFCTPCVKKEGIWLLLRQPKNALAKVNFGARSGVALSFFSLCILSILPFCFLNDVTNA